MWKTIALFCANVCYSPGPDFWLADRSNLAIGRQLKLLLSAEEGNQIFIPIGFAHGFLTLEPETLLSYKVSNYYSPLHDSGIRFDDPLLSIDWGYGLGSIVASEKDLRLPSFDPTARYFA